MTAFGQILNFKQKPVQNNNWFINCVDYVKKGLFFRSPFFKQYYDYYSLWAAMDGFFPDPEKPGFILWLLNPKKTWDELREHMTQDNFAGMYLWNVRSPIYFKRNIREAHVISKDDAIHIHVLGYHFDNEPVAGYCQDETTTIKVNGKVLHKYSSYTGEGCTKNYRMVYQHILEQFVKNNDNFNEKFYE